jgi:peptide/nickel transport system substrate-binding protein
LLALAALIALLGLGACGGSDDDESGDTGGTPAQSEDGGESANVTEQLFAGTARDNIANPAEGGKKGGKLTMLSSGDVDYMDPGKTYYSYAIGIINAIHRGLYAYPPAEALEPVPDLAADMPEIAEDGKTVTVKIREGVMFSAPVKRAVTSKDVKYAIERASPPTWRTATRASTSATSSALRRSRATISRSPASRRRRPDDRLQAREGHRRGAGRRACAADLGTGAEGVRAEVRQGAPVHLRRGHAVYTGPVHGRVRPDGKAVGYQAGKRIHLVRNPDYAAVDDFRPAFVDEIEILAGNDDNAVASRRILSGESLVTGDIEPPASQLKRLLESNKAELSAVPGGGWRMISMDTSRPPFDDIDVRKAVIAGFDRNAARQQRGGEALGLIAQHYIPPGMAGFEESNGIEGWASEMDWMQKPEGDRALSAEYFKKAGMASGKYEGSEEVLIVSDNAEPDKSIAQITEQQLNEMGFKTKLRLVTRDTMFTKFCNVPKSEVHVCPSVGCCRTSPIRRQCSTRRSAARTSSRQGTRTGPSST